MPDFVLDRREVIPRLIPNPDRYLIVARLCGAEGTNYYTMAGAMGGAVAMGLGLALARPDRRVLCVTGDGELLMNIGGLATVAVMNPANFGIICVDNGHYRETGNQLSHTGYATDLAVMASGAGIKQVRTVAEEGQIDEAAAMVRGGNATFFLNVKVHDGPSADVKRSLDANYTKAVFRKALLGTA